MFELNLDIDSYLNNSKNENHTLRLCKENNPSYFKGFLRTAELYQDKLKNKDFLNWLENKMQLSKHHDFNLDSYIQHAVEASVGSYLLRNHFEDVSLDVTVNNKDDKDVDFQLKKDNYLFNIEVKCPVYTEVSNDPNTLNIKFTGRVPYPKDTFNEFSSLMKNTQTKYKDVIQLKNNDNKLKDYLISTHDKTNDKCNDNEVNVLLVACCSAEEMQDYFGFLYGNEGLFTETSFYSLEDYKNVDLVVFTSLMSKHSKPYEAERKTDCWDISKENTLSLIFCNPKRRLDKGDAISSFINIFPNYSKEFQVFKIKSSGNVIIDNFLRIIAFNKDYLEIESQKFLF